MRKIPILIVDDNADDRYILKRIIKDAECASTVYEAENGQDALEFLSDYNSKRTQYNDEFPPIVVFLDINMPLIDGFEFLREFDTLRKTINEYQSIIFMMYSSSENQSDRDRAETYDFVRGYIVKGEISSEQIKSKISDSMKLFKR